MLTFKRHCIEKTPKSSVENIYVNERWTIKKCTYSSGGWKRITKTDYDTKPNETSMLNHFQIILINTPNKDIRYDLFAVNILYIDSITKAFKRQSIRYYTLHNSKTFDITDDILFLDHLKNSLKDDSLEDLFRNKLTR